MDQQTQTKLATLAGGIRPHVVAAAKRVYGGDVTPFDLECIVPVVVVELAGDAEEAAREAFDSKLADRFE